MEKNISRRSFLKGAVVGAAGLTAAGAGLNLRRAKAEEEIAWDEIYDVVVLGYGGAGANAAVAAFEAGCTVTMTNRSFEKCHAFVRHCPLDLHMAELPEVRMEDYDFIIYAIPAAMECLDSWDFSGKTVLEANYANPVLRERVSADGGIYIEGLNGSRPRPIQDMILC